MLRWQTEVVLKFWLEQRQSLEDQLKLVNKHIDRCESHMNGLCDAKDGDDMPASPVFSAKRKRKRRRDQPYDEDMTPPRSPYYEPESDIYDRIASQADFARSAERVSLLPPPSVAPPLPTTLNIGFLPPKPLPLREAAPGSIEDK
jgi:hypothetical protein